MGGRGGEESEQADHGGTVEAGKMPAGKSGGEFEIPLHIPGVTSQGSRLRRALQSAKRLKPTSPMTLTANQILDELRPLGSESYKRMMMKNHGVQEPCFGVKIGDLKKIQKRIKRDHQLALDLYATGNYDAMYLAGLIADDARMSQDDLRRWAEQAYGGALPGATVAWVAAEGPHGRDMAREWIESERPLVALAGWSTWSCLALLKPDAELDLAEWTELLQRVKAGIHAAPDVVRYGMNGFVIAAGSGIAALTDLAIRLGEEIGPVTADLGNNACETPYAPDYIRKVQERGGIGKKRKTVKC
jgi:3-methyladenine DNA glycosylase AlkD